MHQRGRLHHVEMYVSDLKRAREFWSWFLESLGYELYQAWETGFSFKLESTYLVFVQTEARFLDVPYHRSRSGLNHLAFHASSTEDVDAMILKLKEKGVTILYEDRHPYASGSDTYAVFFEGPDRIKLEFVAPDLTQ